MPSVTIAASAAIQLLVADPCRVGPASVWKQQRHEFADIDRDTARAHVPPPNSATCMPGFRPAKRRGLCRTSDQENIVRSHLPALRRADRGLLPFQKTEERRAR